jgi:hypothetical protein
VCSRKGDYGQFLNLLFALQVCFPNGKPIPANAEFIKIPLDGGYTLRDAFVVPDFFSQVPFGPIPAPRAGLHVNAVKVWDALLALDSYDANKQFVVDDIPKAEDLYYGENWSDDLLHHYCSNPPMWLPGNNDALKYRGRPVPRTKIWLQHNYAMGYLKYGYTGWQTRVAAVSRDMLSVHEVDSMRWMLYDATGILFNHGIATKYADGNDCIGPHSDKDRDFKEDSWFCVVKLGAPRPFEFSMAGDPSNTPIWSKVLQPGDAVFVRTKAGPCCANNLLKHSVPRTDPKCGVSGSIVFRCIKTRVSWPRMRKLVAKSLASTAAPADVLEWDESDIEGDVDESEDEGTLQFSFEDAQQFSSEDEEKYIKLAYRSLGLLPAAEAEEEKKDPPSAEGQPAFASFALNMLTAWYAVLCIDEEAPAEAEEEKYVKFAYSTLGRPSPAEAEMLKQIPASATKKQ